MSKKVEKFLDEVRTICQLNFTINIEIYTKIFNVKSLNQENKEKKQKIKIHKLHQLSFEQVYLIKVSLIIQNVLFKI